MTERLDARTFVPETIGFKDHVVLSFDPMDSKTDDPSQECGVSIREVFEDEIARTIWLALKQRCLTNQHFRGDCLSAASWIRKNHRKCTAEILRTGFMTLNHRHMFPAPPLATCVTLLPYLLGEKKITYTVTSERK